MESSGRAGNAAECLQQPHAFPQPGLSVTSVRRRPSSPQCVSTAREARAPLRKRCKTFSNVHNAHENKTCIVSKLRKARNTCGAYKEAVVLFFAEPCGTPRAKCEEHGWKLGSPRERRLNETPARCFLVRYLLAEADVEMVFILVTVFFMTWQSYWCRWGQRWGTRGRRTLLWVLVSDCASVGPSMLCCVKSGGGSYRHLWLVSVFPCCLIQSFLIHPRTKLKGGWLENGCSD